MDKVYRSSSSSHAFFFPVFIHWILLRLELNDFPTSEPIHIIAPIGATFLRQRVAQLKASSKCLRVESSIGDAYQALPFGDPSTKAFVDPIAIMDPAPSTSSASSMRTMLDTVLSVLAAHGQLLLDVLNEVLALQVNLAIARGSTPPAHPLMSHDCLLAICHKKGEYIEIGGEIFFG